MQTAEEVILWEQELSTTEYNRAWEEHSSHQHRESLEYFRCIKVVVTHYYAVMHLCESKENNITKLLSDI